VGLPGADLLRKLQLLKAEKGGLSASDERQFLSLRRWVGARARLGCVSACSAAQPRAGPLCFRALTLPCPPLTPLPMAHNPS
jgi:hypothetical protein